MSIRFSASANGTRNVYDLNLNIVDDYGADPTGIVDCTSAFYTGLKPDIAGQGSVNLLIPSGTYDFITGGGGQPWATGMSNLNVIATGATLKGAVVLGSRGCVQKGIDEAAGQSARIQSVTEGSTSVTLTAASAGSGHISRAIIGQWMMVAGYNIQDLFQAPYGFPANFHFIDYVQITNIVGDTIHFAEPLNNTYLDTWPEINRGNAFEQDAAGPATVFFMVPDFGHTTTFNGGTYENIGALIGCGGLNFIMNGGVSSAAGYPIFPSTNKLWRAVNHTALGALVEHDKLCDWVDVQGGSYATWKEQSSSTRLLTMTDVTVAAITGTSRNTILDGCTIGSLAIGPTGYGRADTFECRNSTISGSIGGGLLETGGFDNPGLQNVMSMSGGIITIPRTMNENGTKAFPPDPDGRNGLLWNGSDGTIGSFQVLEVTGDPWPAVDYQTASTNLTMASGDTSSGNLQVSSSIFSSGDVGKVIIIARTSDGANLKTFITEYISATQITVYSSFASTMSGAAGTLQWGTCNNYVHTNQAGGLPDASLYGSALSIRVPPARTVLFENCTGSETVLDLCQAGAQNKPLWSYTKRTYTGSNGGAILMIGNIVSIKFNVITPYTGVQSTLLAGLNQFNNVPAVIGGALATIGPRVNLKIAGERIIEIGNTTGTQTGDTNMTLASPTWLRGYNFGIYMSQTISGEDPSVWPEFTMEMITDQGF